MSVKKADGNLFQYTGAAESKYELFDELYSGDDILIERIISTGQTTPEGKWLEQERDEWVVLLEGNARIRFDNDAVVEMGRGDYLFIPANTKHRVESTSKAPHCLWLAVHGKLNMNQ
jgi:cupin 2 domain-containing protein